MSIAIREAAPADYAALGELTLAAYAPVHPAEEDAEYLASMRDLASWARACTIYVASDPASGEILGGVRYVPGPEAGPPFAETEREGEAGFRLLAVAPSAQGRGVGRALVEACVARARADGRARLVLLTLPTMTRAQSLYRSMGFARDADRDWHVSEALDLQSFVLDLT